MAETIRLDAHINFVHGVFGSIAAVFDNGFLVLAALLLFFISRLLGLHHLAFRIRVRHGGLG
jgi:hypothetical protein